MGCPSALTEEEAVHVARIGEVRSDLLPVFGCESNIVADIRDCAVPVWSKVYWRVVWKLWRTSATPLNQGMCRSVSECAAQWVSSIDVSFASCNCGYLQRLPNMTPRVRIWICVIGRELVYSIISTWRGEDALHTSGISFSVLAWGNWDYELSSVCLILA